MARLNDSTAPMSTLPFFVRGKPRWSVNGARQTPTVRTRRAPSKPSIAGRPAQGRPPAPLERGRPDLDLFDRATPVGMRGRTRNTV
jgi:hypothetical protein